MDSAWRYQDQIINKGDLMKYFIALLLFVSAIGSAVPSRETRAKGLKAIDSICGDTWCGGDYDFKFRRLLCFDNPNSSCKLYFTMSFKEGEKGRETVIQGGTFQVASESYTFDVACRLSGIANQNDLLTPQGELNQGVYATLTRCINQIERQLDLHVNGGPRPQN